MNKIPRRYNEGCHYQKINGIPITNEIWNEINIFEDIDFVIIETHNGQKHYGQYFDKTTSKPQIYPAFSFGLTDITSTDVQLEYKDGKVNVVFRLQTNRSKFDVVPTRTMLKAERRKQNRKTRKRFDKATKTFRGK